MGLEFIARTTRQEYENASAANWTSGIVLKADARLIGTITLMGDTPNQGAELGYALGKAYRGLGLATEAAAAIIEFGFGNLGLNRIEAYI